VRKEDYQVYKEVEKGYKKGRRSREGGMGKLMLGDEELSGGNGKQLIWRF
jgi:hypothetical protein